MTAFIMPMKRNTESPIRDESFHHLQPPPKKLCVPHDELTLAVLSDDKLLDFGNSSLSRFEEEDDSGIKSGDSILIYDGII